MKLRHVNSDRQVLFFSNCAIVNTQVARGLIVFHCCQRGRRQTSTHDNRYCVYTEVCVFAQPAQYTDSPIYLFTYIQIAQYVVAALRNLTPDNIISAAFVPLHNYSQCYCPFTAEID